MLERSHHSLEKERDILRAALEKLSDSTVQIDTIMATQASSQKMTETELTVVRKQVKEYRDAIDDLREDLIDLEEKLDEKNRHVARTAEQVCNDRYNGLSASGTLRVHTVTMPLP